MAEGTKMGKKIVVTGREGGDDPIYGQAIPLYVMSCFQLSRSFVNELNIHWKNWDHLCCSKLDGGLGFKDF